MSLVPVQVARAAVACAGSSPCVIVQTVGGGSPVTQEFSVEDVLANSVPPAKGPYWLYATRNDQGITGDAHAVTALPIWDLLNLAGVDPRGVDYTSVPTDSSEDPSILYKADLSLQGQDFEHGLVPAVYAVNGQVENGQLAYIRPLRSDTDVNADEYRIITDGAIVVTAYLDKPPLQVTLTSTATSVNVGDRTTFTAGVSRSNAPVVGPVDYRWDIGGAVRRTPDGGNPATTTVTWHEEGTYYVSVNAHDRGSDTYGRAPTVVVVQVGPKPPPSGPPHDPGSGNHHGHHHPPTGPNHGNGHQHHGHQHGSDHHQQGQPTGDTSTTKPGHTDGKSKQGTSQQQAPSGPTKRHPSPTTRGGKAVTGVLLDGAQVVTAAEPTKSVAQVEAAQARPRDHWSVPWGVAGALAVLLLIGLGMAGEALQLRRRTSRMSA